MGYLAAAFLITNKVSVTTPTILPVLTIKNVSRHYQMSSDSEKEGSYFQLKTPVVEELRLIHQDKMSQVAMDCLLAAFLNSLLAFLIF